MQITKHTDTGEIVTRRTLLERLCHDIGDELPTLLAHRGGPRANQALDALDDQRYQDLSPAEVLQKVGIGFAELIVRYRDFQVDINCLQLVLNGASKELPTRLQ